MASPSIISSNTYAASGNGTSHSIPPPASITNGNKLWMLASADGTPNLTCSGWTVEFEATNGDCTLTLLSKTALAESGNYSLASSASETVSAYIFQTESTTTLNILSSIASENTKATGEAHIGECFANTDDTLIVAAIGVDANGNATAGSYQPSGYTGRAALQSGGSTASIGLSVGTKTQAGAAYTGRGFFALNADEEYVAFTFVLQSTVTLSAYPSEAVCLCYNVRSNRTGASNVINRPYGTTAGDLLISHAESESDSLSDLASSNSFTLIGSKLSNSAIFSTNYWKIAASESATYTMTSAANANMAAMTRWANHDPTTPINNSSGNTGSSSAPTGTGFNTTVDNCALFAISASDDDDVAPATGFPSSWSGMYSENTTAGGDAGMIMARYLKATAGATGNPAFSLAASEEWTVRLIAIAPGTVITPDPITASDTPTLSLTESVTIQAGNALTDTPTLSVVDAITIAVMLARTDNPTITLGEAMSIAGTLTASDTPTLSLGEAVTVQAQFTASDTPTLSLTESAAVTVVITPSDTPTLSLSESMAIASSSALSDNPTLTLSESMAIAGSSATTDAPTISLGEAIAIQAIFSAADTPTISLSESMAIASLLSLSDNPTFSVDEVIEISVVLLPADTPTLSLTEAIAIASTSSLADTVSITLGEAMAIAASSSLADTPTITLGTESMAITSLLALADTPTISLGEAVDVTALLDLVDTPTLSLSEAIALAASSALTDTVSISLSEAVAITVLLALGDTPTITLGEDMAVASSSGLSDACSISLVESMAIAVVVAMTDDCALSLDELATVDDAAPPAGGDLDSPRFMYANVGTLMKK